MKKVILATAVAGIFALGASAAMAVQGNEFPVDGTDPDLKVGWDTNGTGGLVVKGNNKVAPTFTVANTRDGVGPRAPVFTVVGRADNRNLDGSPALAVVKSIENHAGLELTRGEGKSWTLFNTRKDGLVLRKEGKSGNWTTYKFFQFNEGDGTFDVFCPQDRSPDLGNNSRYVTSFSPKRQIATSSCPSEN